MSYELSVTLEPDYLRVLVTGHRVEGRQVEDAMAMWTTVAATCKKEGLHKVLVVGEVTGTLSVFDGYEIVSKVEQLGWDRAIRLAIVDRNPQSRPVNDFGETVAVNRGYQVASFADESEALIWLLGHQARV